MARDRPGGTGAIILAAGASQRFGRGPPKALSRAGDGSVLDRIAGLARDRGLTPIVLVVGGRTELQGREIPSTVDHVVENPAWARGRTGSLQRGIRQLPRESSALVWPVDVPFVAGTTVDRLLAAVAEGGLPIWWTPVFRGRGGHPIVLGPSATREVLELSEDFPLREATFRRGVAERRVPVDDPGILDNLNTRAAFALAEAAWQERETG